MMSEFPSPYVPRAGVDPIRCDSAALAVIEMARSDPPVPETIAVLLDGVRRGLAILLVTDTVERDSILTVVELCAEQATVSPDVAALFVASVRPGQPVVSDDVDRWLEASERCDDAGIELVEWYVCDDDGVECPRDRFGEPPRW